MRKNVQSSLATSLHELSVSFRRDQKKYLEKLRENEAKSRYRPAAGTKGENKDLDGFEDSGFSAGQLADLQEIEESAEDREQEISKVLCVCVCGMCVRVCVLVYVGMYVHMRSPRDACGNSRGPGASELEGASGLVRACMCVYIWMSR